MHSTRFLHVLTTRCNPPSGAHSQTSGEHHAAKRLLPQQKMRHVQNRPQHPNPGNTTWRYIINTLSTLHALVQSCIKLSNDSNDTVSSQLCALAAPDHTHAPQLGGTSLRRRTLCIAPPSFCCQGNTLRHTWATLTQTDNNHDSARLENTRRIPETVNRFQINQACLRMPKNLAVHWSQHPASFSSHGVCPEIADMAALLEHGCTTVFREAPLLHPTDSLATIWTSKNPGRRSKDQIDLAACLIMLYATGLDCVIMFLGLLSDWLMVLVISLAGCCCLLLVPVFNVGGYVLHVVEQCNRFWVCRSCWPACTYSLLVWYFIQYSMYCCRKTPSQPWRAPFVWPQSRPHTPQHPFQPDTAFGRPKIAWLVASRKKSNPPTQASLGSTLHRIVSNIQAMTA